MGHLVGQHRRRLRQGNGPGARTTGQAQATPLQDEAPPIRLLPGLHCGEPVGACGQRSVGRYLCRSAHARLEGLLNTPYKPVLYR